jgi:hypothetical protein
MPKQHTTEKAAPANLPATRWCLLSMARPIIASAKRIDATVRHGIGIEKEDLNKISRVLQADLSTNKHRGTGLGRRLRKVREPFGWED